MPMSSQAACNTIWHYIQLPVLSAILAGWDESGEVQPDVTSEEGQDEPAAGGQAAVQAEGHAEL